MAVTFVSQTTPEFWQLFENLSPQIQTTAKNKYEIFKNNPFHTSLRFKKLKKTRASESPCWEVSINECYRAVGIQKENTIYWFWIGDHTEFERLIHQL